MNEFWAWLGGRDGTGYVLGFKVALGRKQTLVNAFNWKGEYMSRELDLRVEGLGKQEVRRGKSQPQPPLRHPRYPSCCKNSPHRLVQLSCTHLSFYCFTNSQILGVELAGKRLCLEKFVARLCCQRSHRLLIRDSAITLLFVIPILGLAGLFSAEDLRYHIFFF
jgi:hypothetical protein